MSIVHAIGTPSYIEDDEKNIMMFSSEGKIGMETKLVCSLRFEIFELE